MQKEVQSPLQSSVRVAPGSELALEGARLQDIAPVFNLIQAGSAAQHFNPVYLQPRYQAGLGLQLFSALWLRRLRYADGRWYPVQLRVLRQRGEFAGFVLLRQLDPSGACHIIDFCALLPDAQHQGLGEWMLRQMLGQLSAGTEVQATCLPASHAMQRVLLRLGFEPQASLGADEASAPPSPITFTCRLPLRTRLG